jgi:hypothetical protein
VISYKTALAVFVRLILQISISFDLPTCALFQPRNGAAA